MILCAKALNPALTTTTTTDKHLLAQVLHVLLKTKYNLILDANHSVCPSNYRTICQGPCQGGCYYFPS